MTDGPRRGGRPSKHTSQRVEAILGVLRSGGTIAAAAGAAEVSEATVYRWLRADARFRDAVKRAEAEAELRFQVTVTAAASGRAAQHDAAGQLIQPEIKPVWQAAAWWLERRRREDYALRTTVNLDLRERAKAIALELDLDVDAILEEAERIIGHDAPGR